jgi:hypothetical protein
MLLRDCLAKVHEDIITCWNFRDEDKILSSDEFKQLMFYLVNDIHGSQNQDGSQSTPPPAIDKISNFVTLITAASAPIAPPAAILGLTYLFVKWLSDAVLDNAIPVQRLFMAYTVDLIKVLESLFDFVMAPTLSGRTTWLVLKEAFEAYERSDSRQRTHRQICANFQQDRQIHNLNSFDRVIHELLGERPPNQARNETRSPSPSTRDTTGVPVRSKVASLFRFTRRRAPPPS